MQTGDRISYHPERAAEEIAHFHEVLPKAQAAVNALDAVFNEHVDEAMKQIGGANYANLDPAAERQRRLDDLHRAELLVAEAAR